jgi:hypothetical protein
MLCWESNIDITAKIQGEIVRPCGENIILEHGVHPEGHRGQTTCVQGT